MKNHDVITLALALVIVGAALVFAALVLRCFGLADNVPTLTLPEPEYVDADIILLERGAAPEVERAGLATHPTFDEAFAEHYAGVDSALAELGGRLLWGEAGCVPDENNRRAALWCAINRAEAWGGTLEQQILEPNQFHGVEIRGAVPGEFVLEARIILALWGMSRDGWAVPRLPLRFTYFEAGVDGLHNVFSTEYGGGEYWDGVEGFDI